MKIFIVFLCGISKLEPVSLNINIKTVKTLKEKVIFDHICHKDHNPMFDDFESLVNLF